MSDEERYPAVGEPAPDFELPDQDGNPVRLSELRGKSVILYFYPRDDTPGCTAQACSIRDNYEDFGDAVVLGLSHDSVASHRRFKDKYGLPFTLLADTDHAVAEAYGVWVEKKSFGRKGFGIERTSFVIDPEGRIARVLPKVKPTEHTELALDSLGA